MRIGIDILQCVFVNMTLVSQFTYCRLAIVTCVLFASIYMSAAMPLRRRKRQPKLENVTLADSGPTGTWQNAGVIYSPKYLANTTLPTLKEPASFTPYIEDYMLTVQRPKMKPFPNF